MSELLFIHIDLLVLEIINIICFRHWKL